MKVGNVIRGGAVIAASVALVSLGTGMGLSALTTSTDGPAQLQGVQQGSVLSASHRNGSRISLANSGSRSSFLTVAQGKALGIYPGMPGPNGTIPIVAPAVIGPDTTAAGLAEMAAQEPRVAALTLRPESAYGCNNSVCISISGQGLFVSDWYTSAYFVGHVETFAVYWDNGKPCATSNAFWSTPSTWESSEWTPDEYFSNNTQLCNSWWDHSGYPCETVYK
jgi:hypothetical protein